MAKTATFQSGQSRFSYKIVIGAGLVLAVLGGLIVAARPGPAPGIPAPGATVAAVVPQSSRILVAKELNFNFGSVSMAAGKVTHRYWIRNTGSTPIVVRKMYTSCMCTTAALVKGGRKFDPYGMPGHGLMPTLNQPIAPDEAAMIEVVFDPAAHGPAGIGKIERIVTIQTDLESPLELAFVANVTP